MFSVFLLAVSFYEKEARSNICYFFWAAHCLRSFFYGAGNALPYPDPTPELIAYQDNNAKKSIHRLYCWLTHFRMRNSLAALTVKKTLTSNFRSYSLN